MVSEQLAKSSELCLAGKMLTEGKCQHSCRLIHDFQSSIVLQYL